MGKSTIAIMTLILLLAAGLCFAEKNAAGDFDNDFYTPLLPGHTIPTPGPLASVAAVDSAVIAGADYLKGMQADITEDNAGNGTDGIDENPDDPDDGGWDWIMSSPQFSHSVNASPTNLYGVTALGAYYAYLQTGDTTYMTTIKDAADTCIAAGANNIRTARDLIFLMKFNDMPEITGTAYQDSAKAKYDSRISYYGSAKALAEFIRDMRNSQGYPNGIIPWDIGAFAVAAQMLDDRFPGNNYAADADSIAEVLYQDSYMSNPGYFDIIGDQGWDSTYSNTNYYWYTLGITGLLDAFVSANVHTAEIPGLLTILNDCRYTSGAYSFSYGANNNDEDWQSTAYSVMSLARYDQSANQADINITAEWLASTQDSASGGFVYGNGDHLPEIGGECTSAMYFAEEIVVIPTLSEWGMLIMGLLLLAIGTAAVIRRRKDVLLENK